MTIYRVQITEEDGPSHPSLVYAAADLPAVVLLAAKDRYGKDCAVRHRWDNVYQAMWERSSEFESEGIWTFKKMKFIEVNAEILNTYSVRFQDASNDTVFNVMAFDELGAALGAAEKFYGVCSEVKHVEKNVYLAMCSGERRQDSIPVKLPNGMTWYMFQSNTSDGIGPRTERFRATIELVTALPIPSKDDGQCDPPCYKDGQEG
jgi:hypothetical protein